MKRLALIAALFCLIPVLRADDAPEVKTSETPEVTDPDLKDATPAMRQGTEEPVGGFKDAGMAGRSALVLGLSQMSVAGGRVGYRHWPHDHLAVMVALGGSYDETQNNSAFFGSTFLQEASLRLKAAELGGGSFLYVDLGGGANQTRNHSESKTVNATYDQYNISHGETYNYGAFVGLGAELFWPGSRRVSLEGGASFAGSWGTSTNTIEARSSDGVSGSNSKTSTTTRSYEVSSDYRMLFWGLNVYF